MPRQDNTQEINPSSEEELPRPEVDPSLEVQSRLEFVNQVIRDQGDVVKSLAEIQLDIVLVDPFLEQKDQAVDLNREVGDLDTVYDEASRFVRATSWLRRGRVVKGKEGARLDTKKVKDVVLNKDRQTRNGDVGQLAVEQDLAGRDQYSPSYQYQKVDGEIKKVFTLWREKGQQDLLDEASSIFNGQIEEFAAERAKITELETIKKRHEQAREKLQRELGDDAKKGGIFESSIANITAKEAEGVEEIDRANSDLQARVLEILDPLKESQEGVSEAVERLISEYVLVKEEEANFNKEVSAWRRKINVTSRLELADENAKAEILETLQEQLSQAEANLTALSEMKNALKDRLDIAKASKQDIDSIVKRLKKIGGFSEEENKVTETDLLPSNNPTPNPIPTPNPNPTPRTPPATPAPGGSLDRAIPWLSGAAPELDATDTTPPPAPPSSPRSPESSSPLSSEQPPKENLLEDFLDLIFGETGDLNNVKNNAEIANYVKDFAKDRGVYEAHMDNVVSVDEFKDRVRETDSGFYTENQYFKGLDEEVKLSELDYKLVQYYIDQGFDEENARNLAGLQVAKMIEDGIDKAGVEAVLDEGEAGSEDEAEAEAGDGVPDDDGEITAELDGEADASLRLAQAFIDRINKVELPSAKDLIGKDINALNNLKDDIVDSLMGIYLQSLEQKGELILSDNETDTILSECTKRIDEVDEIITNKVNELTAIADRVAEILPTTDAVVDEDQDAVTDIPSSPDASGDTIEGGSDSYSIEEIADNDIPPEYMVTQEQIHNDKIVVLPRQVVEVKGNVANSNIILEEGSQLDIYGDIVNCKFYIKDSAKLRIKGVADVASVVCGGTKKAEMAIAELGGDGDFVELLKSDESTPVSDEFDKNGNNGETPEDLVGPQELKAMVNGEEKVITMDDIRNDTRPLINLLTLTAEAAKYLVDKYEGDYLYFDLLEEISDQAAKQLMKHKGIIDFARLTTVSNKAAEYLSKCKGTLIVEGSIREKIDQYK